LNKYRIFVIYCTILLYIEKFVFGKVKCMD